MNPLVVPCSLREEVDTLLINLQPLAIAQMLPDNRLQGCGVFEYSCHFDLLVRDI